MEKEKEEKEKEKEKERTNTCRKSIIELKRISNPIKVVTAI